ncbi:MAG: hypothetical protein RMJ03_07185, partial [Nitrososphaerota archaeon]|nr:hypothetical protein [Nitrososphaerota archaeon]
MKNQKSKIWYAKIPTILELRDNVMKKVDKPWGYEEVLVNDGGYLVKRLVLKDETSTHYHNVRN